MRSTGALLAALSWALLGASCQERPAPPSAVEIKVGVPIACKVAEPECRAPAYDAARKEMQGDVKVKLLRAEAALQEDCLRRYRDALAVCRKPVAPK